MSEFWLGVCLTLAIEFLIVIIIALTGGTKND